MIQFLLGIVCGFLLQQILFPQTVNNVNAKIKNSNDVDLTENLSPKPKRFLGIFKRKQKPQ